MFRRRPRGPVPDVFETFADQVDTSEQQAPVSAGSAARSAGIGIVLLTLGGVAFVAGFSWGLRQEFGLVYDPVEHQDMLFWEGVAKVVYAAVAGLVVAGAVVAVTLLGVGLPWVRRQHADKGI